MNNVNQFLNKSLTHTCAITTAIRQQLLFLCLFYQDDSTRGNYERTQTFPTKEFLLERARDLNYNFISFKFATYAQRYFFLPIELKESTYRNEVVAFGEILKKFKTQEEHRSKRSIVDVEQLLQFSPTLLTPTINTGSQQIRSQVIAHNTPSNTFLEIKIEMDENDPRESRERRSSLSSVLAYTESENDTIYDAAAEELIQNLSTVLNSSMKDDEEMQREEGQQDKPRPLAGRRIFKEEQKTVRINAGTAATDRPDDAKPWKNHRIPRYEESGLSVRDWATKVIFMIDLGRTVKMTDNEKIQLILENIPSKSFGAIIDAFQSEAKQDFNSLIDVITEELQIDEGEAGMTLSTLRFVEDKDKNMKKFFEKIKKLVKIKYPQLDNEGVLTTAMEHFERLLPNYVTNSESWGLDTYDHTDPGKRIALANRIFNLHRTRKSINALIDRNNSRKSNKNDKKQSYCKFCKINGHDRSECRKCPTCSFCQIKGHTEEECFKKKKAGQTKSNNNYSGKTQKGQTFGNRGASGKQNKTGECFKCGSKDHWANKCPKRINTVNVQESHPFIQME